MSSDKADVFIIGRMGEGQAGGKEQWWEFAGGATAPAALGSETGYWDCLTSSHPQHMWV